MVVTELLSALALVFQGAAGSLAGTCMAVCCHDDGWVMKS